MLKAAGIDLIKLSHALRTGPQAVQGMQRHGQMAGEFALVLWR